MSSETPQFHPATLDLLAAWVAEADDDADKHATRGGEARALAQQHLAEAALHDERAAEARAIADERRWLLKMVQANQKPPVFPSAPFVAPVLAAPVEVPLAAPELVPMTPQMTPPDGFRPVLPVGVVPFETECPAGCGQLVFPGQNGPVHLIEGGTVAACRPPVVEDPAPTRLMSAVEVEEQVR